MPEVQKAAVDARPDPSIERGSSGCRCEGVAASSPRMLLGYSPGREEEDMKVYRKTAARGLLDERILDPPPGSPKPGHADGDRSLVHRHVSNTRPSSPSTPAPMPIWTSKTTSHLPQRMARDPAPTTASSTPSPLTFEVAGTINNRAPKSVIQRSQSGSGTPYTTDGTAWRRHAELGALTIFRNGEVTGGGTLTNTGASVISGSGEIDVAVNNKKTVTGSTTLTPVIDGTSAAQPDPQWGSDQHGPIAQRKVRPV